MTEFLTDSFFVTDFFFFVTDFFLLQGLIIPAGKLKNFRNLIFNAGKIKLYQVGNILKKIEKRASAYRWKANFKGFSENTGFQGVRRFH